MERITNAQRKIIRSLSTVKGRRAEGAFAVEGTKSVLDLLGGTFVLRTLVATAEWYDTHRVCCDRSVMLRAVTADMERMSSLSTPPDVIAVFETPVAGDLILDRDRLVVAVDGVQDPGNLGTILRLCDWFGVSDILASHTTVDVFNPKCVMATMGSIARVGVHYVDLPSVLGDAEKARITVWGTFLDGTDIYDIPDGEPRTGVIVMGNEGKGISDDVARVVNRRILIPAYPPGRQGAESLNVAMATAITLAEFRRPRK